jgi:hypothetical protein
VEATFVDELRHRGRVSTDQGGYGQLKRSRQEENIVDDWWLIAVIVAVVVLALVAWVVMRRRSRAGSIIASGHGGPASRSEGKTR